MIYEQIKGELREAMKAKDAIRTMVIKGLLADFTNELVAQKRKPDEQLNDEDILKVITRAVKQRKDSIEQFIKGGREDLANDEKDELVYLERYLPELMSEDEIRMKAITKKTELKIEDKAKIGILIGAIMKDLAGKADGGVVKKVVERLF